MKRTLKELQELWDKLGDIPVNNDDEIEEDFLNFPAGTSKFDVWHWFDAVSYTHLTLPTT